jgi:hypothetical protein
MGGGGIYIKNGQNCEAIMEKLLPALREMEGIEAIMLPDDLAKRGQAVVEKDRRAADVMLPAKDGYAFSARVNRSSVIYKIWFVAPLNGCFSRPGCKTEVTEFTERGHRAHRENKRIFLCELRVRVL